ncbi:MAG: Mutator mutT protein (7,8-dihydro-8-oxoguanine-triphosphatase) / thiamin-phosphate pyrophosphorylase-like protein, partial [Candidatus Shapirobacteria bacterium GW2011_GWF1_38_23]
MEKIVSRAIILGEKGSILLGKRANGSLAGRWALIGEKPNQGETEEQAVVRETGEEIGARLLKPIFWKEVLQEAITPGDFLRESYFFGIIATNIEELNLNLEEISEVGYVSRS